MFWGLVLEPGKRYAQTVDTAFHVSMACLEAKQSDNELTSVILDHNDREFILCSLQRQKFLQSQLDLNFSSGEKIAFLTSGQGKVHLTGYLIEQDDDDEDEDYEMSEDAETAVSLSDKLAGKLAASAKRKKKQNSPKEDKKKQKLSNAVDDDESDFPTSDLEEDDSDEVVVGSGGDDDSDEEEEDAEEEEESDEEDSDEVTTGKKNSGTTQFSSAGSTPFRKKLEGKGKQLTPGLQKGEKSLKSTPIGSHKKEKSPTTGHMNVCPTNITEGTPGEKSGKKKKNKNKGVDSITNTPVQGKSPVASITPAKTPKQTLAGGVLIEESKIGNGPAAKQGSYVTVYYTGRLKHNNKQFDAVNEGTGFKFRLGSNEVIRGWDIGIPGMKVGGKRKIVIPPQMAYGNKGSPPAIPPNSSLVFEVELRNVK